MYFWNGSGCRGGKKPVYYILARSFTIKYVPAIDTLNIYIYIYIYIYIWFFVLWFFKNFYLFIYLWLCWVFVSVLGLSPVAASGGHSSSRCAGLSLSRPLLVWSTGSRRTGSIILAHGPSCSAACGIFPDQGSNPCPLHWQADSQPLRHQGSPIYGFFNTLICSRKDLRWLGYKLCGS